MKGFGFIRWFFEGGKRRFTCFDGEVVGFEDFGVWAEGSEDFNASFLDDFDGDFCGNFGGDFEPKSSSEMV